MEIHRLRGTVVVFKCSYLFYLFDFFGLMVHCLCCFSLKIYCYCCFSLMVLSER